MTKEEVIKQLKKYIKELESKEAQRSLKEVINIINNMVKE